MNGSSRAPPILQPIRRPQPEVIDLTIEAPPILQPIQRPFMPSFMQPTFEHPVQEVIDLTDESEPMVEEAPIQQPINIHINSPSQLPTQSVLQPLVATQPPTETDVEVLQQTVATLRRQLEEMKEQPQQPQRRVKRQKTVIIEEEREQPEWYRDLEEGIHFGREYDPSRTRWMVVSFKPSMKSGFNLDRINVLIDCGYYNLDSDKAAKASCSRAKISEAFADELTKAIGSVMVYPKSLQNDWYTDKKLDSLNSKFKDQVFCYTESCGHQMVQSRHNSRSLTFWLTLHPVGLRVWNGEEWKDPKLVMKTHTEYKETL